MLARGATQRCVPLRMTVSATAVGRPAASRRKRPVRPSPAATGPARPPPLAAPGGHLCRGGTRFDFLLFRTINSELSRVLRPVWRVHPRLYFPAGPHAEAGENHGPPG